MVFDKGDRVVFTGLPRTDVSEWLLRNRVQGTVVRYAWEEGDDIVIVRWDGLRDMIQADGRKHGSSDWAVYEDDLGLWRNENQNKERSSPP